MVGIINCIAAYSRTQGGIRYSYNHKNVRYLYIITKNKTYMYPDIPATAQGTMYLATTQLA